MAYLITEGEFSRMQIDPVDGHLKTTRDNGTPVDFGLAMGAAVTDAGVAEQISNPASQTFTALSAEFPSKAALPVNLSDYASTTAEDQTANVQAAVDATPDGGTLIVPAGRQFRVDGSVLVDHPMTIMSEGRGGLYSGLTGTAAQAMIDVTSGDVHLRGLKLVGPQFTAQAMQYGVRFTGASAASPLVDVSVQDCDISKFAYFGIYAQQVKRIKFDGNTVHDIAYGAIMTASAIGGSIDRNIIYNVTKATYADAYGISASRLYGSLVDHPRSASLSICNNKITDVPSWAGIDTHAGESLVIDGNIITNTYFPISAVSSKTVGTGAYDLASLNIHVTNNLCNSGVTDGTRGSLNIIGNATEKATGKIVGNTVRGHGLQGNSQGAGIGVDFTHGIIITDNRLVECSVSGIILVGNNTGFVINNNVIVDAWSTANIAKAIYLSGDYNTGRIDGNQGLLGGRTETSIMGLGVAVTSQPNTEVTLGSNRMAVALTPLWDTGNKTRLAFFGAVGASKPAAPGTATGTDAAVINALTAALRSFGAIT